MTITERVAYLKGLAEGLSLDTQSKEGKILTAMIDILDDMAYEISDTQEMIGELGEQLDMIDEDLDALEEIVYEDEEDDDDCGCGCGCGCDDDDEDEDFDDSELFEVVCPTCGDCIYLDEGMLDEGEMDCPSCGEHLEFDFEFDGEENDEE